MPESIVAALVGLCSACALEVLRHLLRHFQKAAVKSVDDAASFRQDLLARIEALEEEARVAQERDDWQERYYQEREQFLKSQLGQRQPEEHTE